jgi:hypothetical protein
MNGKVSNKRILSIGGMLKTNTTRPNLIIVTSFGENETLRAPG